MTSSNRLMKSIMPWVGRLGFVMAEAASSSDALARATILKPDLVLMDVVLPDTDGVETSTRIRALPGLETVPIVAVSASVFGDDEARCLAAGLDASLPKPIEFGRLLECIAPLLDLDWCYAAVQVHMQEPMQLGRLEAPPPEEMEVLYRLARVGNMQDILARADYVDGLDIRYRPFAEQLRLRASKFQSKAITGFIEQHMEGRQEQTSSG